jgi:ABC-type Fe3+/spermidine/putrescine transport system ATPase subunit
MPWLDQLIVLQEGRLIQKDNAEYTYKEPYNQYVAQLFGEVNIFSDEEKVNFQLSKNFYYPNEIILSEIGEEAEVLESRFAGSYFWNKIVLDGKILFIYTTQKIEGEIYLKFI